MAYEAVIGLEVHIELNTKTKLFCGCRNAFGEKPNTLCCPVCAGMPGTLPVLNKQAVRFTIKAGLATGCQISNMVKMDRKNYYYPDLPKGYQITQYDMPLCRDGFIDIGDKRIGIDRIHLEEDAGKLIHNGSNTLIDLNRCGVPLIEIVSKPDMRSAEEAAYYLKKLRTVILYTGISDCKMNEGAFRVDINISLRKKGSYLFGARTEIKNLNSFKFAREAIAYEISRQMALYEKEESPIKETRRYDEKDRKTYTMRAKENTNEYRYFSEPDLVPVSVSDNEIEMIKKTLPALPSFREKMYKDKYALSQSDCEILLGDMKTADYFEEAARLSKNPKGCANSILSGSESILNVKPARLARIADLVFEGFINNDTAKKMLLTLCEEDCDPDAYIGKNGLYQINDEAILNGYIDKAFAENEKAVDDIKKGRTKAVKTLTGTVMSETKGRANPAILQRLIEEKLSGL